MWVRIPGRDGGTLWVEEFSREEFLAERWHYRPGDHVTILAPTDWGKTTLTSQLLTYTAHPRLPAIRFALKPRDLVMKADAARMGYPIVRAWPPGMLARWRRPNGWVLWPHQSGDPDIDDTRLGREIRQALIWAYNRASKDGRTGVIIDADEMEEIQRLLAAIGKASMLRGLYRRMRSNGGGMWAGCQAPRWLVTDAYSQCAHLLLGNDPEARNRERFGEIGGVNPKIVEAVTLELPERHFLYLRRRGRVMCIIGP